MDLNPQLREICTELINLLLLLLSSSQNLFVDITSVKFNPIGVIFKTSARPDTVIRHDSELFVLELTVCHESNLMPSKTYKLNKYKNLSHHLINEYKHYNRAYFKGFQVVGHIEGEIAATDKGS